MFSIIFLTLHALLSQAVYDLLMEDYNNFALPVGLVGNHHPKELTYVGIHNMKVPPVILTVCFKFSSIYLTSERYKLSHSLLYFHELLE
jgi:hypothetical protein